jgi:hypothetical protein
MNADPSEWRETSTTREFGITETYKAAASSAALSNQKKVLTDMMCSCAVV